MNGLIITNELVEKFGLFLRLEEKSAGTIEKYTRDVKKLSIYSCSCAATKETVIAYKESLMSRYAVRTVNSVIASLNSFFVINGG